MKIAIVCDQEPLVGAIRHALRSRPQDQIVWTADNGEEALLSCARDTPNLLLMSLATAGMGSVEATRRILRAHSCTILIVALDVERQRGQVSDAMRYGALDVVEFAGESSVLVRQTRLLLSKVDTMARLLGVSVSSLAPRPARQLVAIGASAGGPSALATLLGALPASFPAAIVIVQHVDAQFAESMADWLGQRTQLPVRVARAGESPTVSCVLLAGTSNHLVFASTDTLDYTVEPADYVYRPSVDVFFHSVNRHWQGKAVGVLLTGMGRDGALGLKAMRARGHYTIAQDQASSAVYGMPKSAVQLGAADDILSLMDIAPHLMRVCV